LWFVTFDAQIGRITPDGATITLFDVPPAFGAKEIAAGSDGNLWFVDITENAIGRITPEGEFTTFPIPTPIANPNGIAAGPDGNAWFTENFNARSGKLRVAF